MMRIVDTHCHLDFDRFEKDRDQVIERARMEGVIGFILIGIDPESWNSTREIVDNEPGFWRTAGLHPNSVDDQWNPELAASLEAESASGSLVGIGETGVDLYRSESSRAMQMEAFDAHIELAKSYDLPVVIHQRSAEKEVLEVLERHGEVSGVMHCFGGDWNFARQCLDLGLHLGIGGVATFRSSQSTRDAIARAPEDRLLLETDAPFLAPQPVRGKRNEPAFLRHVVDVVADCRSRSSEHIAHSTTENAVRLFGLEV
ncbi:MAG: TatD family hydrolase [Thermomicrobiales bacterium]